MMKYRLCYWLWLALLLFDITQAAAGYTIRIVPQVTPATVTVRGEFGEITVPNAGVPVIDPPGYHGVIWRPDDFDRYSASPAKRTELLADDYGTATDVQIFAQCSGIRDFQAKKIRREGSKRLQAIVNPYLPEERESWGVQMKEAEGCLMDPVAGCTPSAMPMLSAIAANRGIPVMEMMNKVWDNVTLYRQAVGAILGVQQRLLDQVDATTTVDGLLAIGWPP